MSDTSSKLEQIVEGALMAAGEPLKIERFQGLFDEHAVPEKQEIEAALQAVAASCEGRAYELVEVASGWRFQVREALASWVNRLWEEKPQKYSRALLETLSLIAYRQPITRGDIEDVRGVAVSSHIIKTLVERDWVKVVGHRDVPGRPALYATTRQFLDYFNLKSLDELPSLGELKDIDSLNQSLDLQPQIEQSEATDTEEREQGAVKNVSPIEVSEAELSEESLEETSDEHSVIDHEGQSSDIEDEQRDFESKEEKNETLTAEQVDSQ